MQSHSRSIRRLFLLRHAHSAWPRPGQKDFDRTLDEAGRHEAEQLASLAASAGFSPDEILCSPAARCRETAAIFVSAMQTTPLVRYDDRLYGDSVEHYLAVAHAAWSVDCLMIVGHNPMIEGTLLRLAGREVVEKHIPGGFPTAGLAVFAQFDAEDWRFETLLAP